MCKFIDLTNMKFDRLKVVEKSNKKGKKGQIYWICKCDCNENKLVEVLGASLRGKTTRSCGCLFKETQAINIANIANNNKKYNNYDLAGECGIGYTNNGIKFCFDIEDYDKIKLFCWNINSKGYITCNTKMSEQGYCEQIFLHRLILGLPNKKDGTNWGGHEDRNPLNNRKSNLKIITHAENMYNKSKYKNNTSGVRGVNFDNQNNRWRARLAFEKKYVLNKLFDNFLDAVNARREAELKFFGKYLTLEGDY